MSVLVDVVVVCLSFTLAVAFVAEFLHRVTQWREGSILLVAAVAGIGFAWFIAQMPEPHPDFPGVWMESATFSDAAR